MQYNKAELEARLQREIMQTMPHRWRNRFHVEMPFGFTGSVKGFLRFGEEHYIFLQWNPFSTEDKNKGWVLVKTRDFIRYSMPQLVLWPGEDMDRDGCGSGCAYVEDGKLRVLYTGRRTEGEVRDNRQILGTLDGGVIRKDGVVIKEPPEGYTHLFQGPFRFTQGGKNYILLGGQAEPEDDPRGCVLIYREEEGEWKFEDELSTQLGFFGSVWECPIVERFGEQEVLFFSPRGVKHLEFAYQNLFQSGYIAGRMMATDQTMLHASFRELDRGFDFFVPYTAQFDGRHVMIGWMSMPHRDEDYPTAELGFMHTLTMPRELTLKQGRVYSRPAEELKDLRIEESRKDIESCEVKKLQMELFEGSEGYLRITFGHAEDVHLIFHYGEEKLVLTYRREDAVLEIVRNDMALGGKGGRRFRLPIGDTFHVRFFQDKSAMEFFFQHGEEAASLMVFPKEDVRPVLEVKSSSRMEKVVGTVWELDPIQYNLQ
ncbi:sucrose-6-phosphate hydrolase [Selenomonas sp. TAMA-11512]|uniref:glycoside hydrolase family 32 protein n=1 Tax=Selenomonas sp. TAMA-11512 TaxID=3095337 RepID=UPI00308AD202|nr:sucrose-6-phosphate hydrolase [Selenomonas sp. TAMA-11512]